MIKEFFILFSAISFVVYSLNSVFSRRMISEFSRWGVGNLRILVACFQMLGGIGLLLGMYNIWLLCLVSFLLMIMMIIAIIIRIRVNDSFFLIFPALIYAVLSFIIFYSSFVEIYA
tara:strand:- start:5468 stop:5815 length:348 start_codon:yes stop_codon:yes gene_type:complete